MDRRFAIDLTWVRPGKLGGTESNIRNILDGMAELNEIKFTAYLLVSVDNVDSFKKYEEATCFELIVCNVHAFNVKGRVLWQNLFLESVLKRNKINKCYEPIYSIPFIRLRGIKYYSTIHDLQALHFPEYFSKMRVLWMKLSWINTIKHAEKVIAISEYVKNDICKKFQCNPSKVKVIYDAISNLDCYVDEKSVMEKYGIQKNSYYYTVSSMLPHKNLKTLIRVIGKLKEVNSPFLKPLVISGLGGKDKGSLIDEIHSCGVEEFIIITDYVETEERNTLYNCCSVFLFPSVFEGFGMPPVEALFMRKKVVASSWTSIYEVTQGAATYVSNPYDINEWIDAIIKLHREHLNCKRFIKDIYDGTQIADKYVDVIMN